MQITAELIDAIVVTFARGEGTEEEPVRVVKRYFLPDSTFIGEKDPVKYKRSAISSQPKERLHE